MTFVKRGTSVLWHLSLLLSLGGCGTPGPECDTLESRNSVVKVIADDHNNALVTYAANNSEAVATLVGNASLKADKLAVLEAARRDAIYRLDETVNMETRDNAAHKVTCSGALDVTVMDTTANKAVTFSVTQTAEGKTLISVDPFLFNVSHED
jgi:hypothetical protein